MKLLFWALATLLVLFVALYVLAFTQAGNDLIKPYVQKQLRQQTATKIILKDFSLRFNSFFARASLGQSTAVRVEGTFDIFSRTLRGEYELEVDDLRDLQHLHQQRLRGGVRTFGTVAGSVGDIAVEGTLESAEGQAEYSARIVQNSVTKLEVAAREFSVGQLLWMSYNDPLASGRLQINADLADLVTRPRGDIKFFIKEGRLRANWLEENYGIILADNSFQAGGRAEVKETVTYDVALKSTPLSFFTAGNATDQKQIRGDYEVSVPRLSQLEPVIGYKLAGDFSARGSYSGTLDALRITMQTSAAGSDTSANALIKDKKLERLQGSVQHLSLQKLLQMAKREKIAKGRGDIVFDLCRGADAFEGSVVTKLTDGRIDASLLRELSGVAIGPHNGFSLQAESTLEKNSVVSKLRIDSDLAQVQAQKVAYNLEENTLFAPLVLSISDLSRLQSVTKTKLRGSAEFDADVIYDSAVAGGVLVNANTSSFGGNIKMKYQNSRFESSGSGVDIWKLLHTLQKPKLLQGKADFEGSYSLDDKTGRLRADLAGSRMSENFFTKAIKRYRGIDLSARQIEEGFFHSNLRGSETRSDFTLSMEKARLQSKDLFIDTDTGRIRGSVDLTLPKHAYTLGIDGNTDDLKDAIDYESLLRKEIERQIEKKANEKLKEKLGDKVYERFKGLF
ncbi:MAG: hypothetical protein ACQERK_03620 [Campylobacterota bacterium]